MIGARGLGGVEKEASGAEDGSDGAEALAGLEVEELAGRRSDRDRPAGMSAAGQEEKAEERAHGLEELKVDLDGGDDGDGESVAGARLEAPLGERRGGLFVQAEAGAAEDLNVGGLAGGVDFELEDGGAGESGGAGFVGIGRFDLGE